MSKAKLKKELENMSAEQLREVILDAYDAAPEIKQYFEYFLNPDENKLMNDFVEFVCKEFNRVKRHNCKARVSAVKRELKKLQGFGVSYVRYTNAFLNVIMQIGIADKFCYLADAHYNLVDYCTEQALCEADKTGQYSELLERIDKAIMSSNFPTFDIKDRCRRAIQKHKEKL